MGMPRIESSEIRVQTVMAGSLWLDGGAMFGVVPKTLWSRRTDADERNRIQLAMRCLLIETEAATILVDTGLGNKDDDKFHDIYGVSNAGEPTRLESSLRAIGVEPGQVDIVVNTHLHFDHAGGNTVRRPDGRVEPTFPNAAYAIQRGEWDYARLDNERVQASYVADNFVPLEAAGRVRWLDGERESIVPGVEVIRTPGHTPFHQSHTCRCRGSWDMTSSRWSRSSRSGTGSDAPFQRAGCSGSSTIRWSPGDAPRKVTDREEQS
jgi:glyoxylase-like metal-dependent hydrolase (beta-lactamase superfamily II)